MRGRMLRTAGAATAALVLVGCGADVAPAPTPTVVAEPPASASPSPALPAEPTDVVTGIAAPWSVAVIGDSALVSERDSARILEVVPGDAVREVAVVDGVVADGEGGLLGIATGPDAASLYVYSTAEDGNRVQRYPLEGEPGTRTLGAPETIIDGLPRAGIHNGGRIAFSPDGMLYVTTGDAGEAGAAQNPDSLAGKILRLTPEGGIPDDNPEPGSPVYSLGHRNVQGLDWTDDGRLFATEFGQDAWDELNLIEPGGNYGWPQVEGEGGADAGYIDPVQQWRPDAASPSGMAIIGDTIYIANLRGGVLRTVPVDEPTTAAEHLAGEYGRLRTAVEGPAGALWIVTNNTDGRGEPRPGDDRILAVDPSALTG
ncbi:PQQ-dependent sugar dehydrogenase [Microbacterium sp. LRZ72]|uniref:PQQ-dependent sugar dehydrogenase n=1 Tax=Microbacterium sp. LRZ72 TaxID=2942481 RepID=UPI0029B1892D|nr:PQQ-dependent sugar dehydrogenase [Microbacterium sp. LRZ72]MDX2376081.1 PQQ-dependent sugar dehydrogenase [Microbacterium sp. LRZ72]